MKKTMQLMSELRKKSHADLVKDLKKHQDELVLLKVRLSLQKEKNNSLVRKARVAIARIETVLHEESHHETK